MASNIEFKDNQDMLISNLENIKIITLSDERGNKYTLDASNGSLKLKYQQNDQDEISYTVEGLAAALKNLLDIKSTNDDKHTVLEEKLAEKSIVEAIFYAKDLDANDRISSMILDGIFPRQDVLRSYLDKKADVKNVYNKGEVDEELNKKADVKNVYDKGEVDRELNKKIDVGNVYTKKDIDEGFVPAKSDGMNKLARELFGKHESNATSILVNALGKLLDEKHDIYGNNKTAKDFLAEKGNFAKADGSNIDILEFTQKILDATWEMGDGKRKSILVEKLGRFLDQTADNENAYDGKIAKAFLGDKGMKGPKGDPGQRGEVGQDGKGPAPDVVAQELISSNLTKLGQAILNVKNKFGNDEKPALETHLANNSSFQESIAGNQDLRTAVTTNLSSDRDFHNIVRRDLSKDGESLLIDDESFFEIPDDPNGPLSWDW